MLRRLEALLVVADAETTLVISGAGDVIEPDDGIVAIGSGGPYALAAARALVAHRELAAAADRRGGHEDRRRHLHLHQRPDRRGGSAVTNFTPREIVSELDRYIIGQNEAKRAVAVALRNRWRRQQVPRRAARRDRAEEHHHDRPDRGRQDRDRPPPGQAGPGPLRQGRGLASSPRSATSAATSRPWSATWSSWRSSWSRRRRPRRCGSRPRTWPRSGCSTCCSPAAKRRARRRGGRRTEHEPTRDKLRQLLRKGELDERFVELETQDAKMPMMEIFTPQGIEEMGINLKEMFGNLFPEKDQAPPHQGRRGPRDADRERGREAGRHGQGQHPGQGAHRAERHHLPRRDRQDRQPRGGAGPDVSREGVQRDILPIVEGTTVNTKYGLVKTDHILFIAAGAFHVAKPSRPDPRAAGALSDPGRAGEPRRGGVRPHPHRAEERPDPPVPALLGHRGDRARLHRGRRCTRLARTAAQVNERTENIGARRLHTILEKLLEELSFDAPERQEKTVTIDAAYVRERLAEIVKDEDCRATSCNP